MNNVTTETKDEAQAFGAYLVIIRHNETGLVGHMGIYSEESPTCPTTHHTEVLFETRASSFAAARDELEAIVRASMRWAGGAYQGKRS